jgi:hypothetical protein
MTYYLLSGKTPFAGANHNELFEKILLGIMNLKTRVYK